MKPAILALIEAGQHAHRALLRPLVERGLEPGDDAVLLLLDEGATGEESLAEATGLTHEALRPRLDRLIARGLIVRTTVGLVLTERGARLRVRLLEVWDETERALTGELGKKQRKRIVRLLLDFARRPTGRGGEG